MRKTWRFRSVIPNMLAFTNISQISEGMSDALCRVASGEGLGTRALYTNDEEVLFGGFRPICLNGIKDFIEKGDLLDRVLLVDASVYSEKRPLVPKVNSLAGI